MPPFFLVFHDFDTFVESTDLLFYRMSLNLGFSDIFSVHHTELILRLHLITGDVCLDHLAKVLSAHCKVTVFSFVIHVHLEEAT